MRIDILTIFPSLFDSFLGESLLAKAIEKKIVDCRVHDLRNWSKDKHRNVDDSPFGGGAGMVMTPQPIADALEEISKQGKTKKILLSPRGKPFTQEKARELASLDRITLVCGRYEGVDERIARHYVDEEISIGDFILSGGEVAAMALVESIFRLLPGAIGKEESLVCESFEENLLEYPHYTRPEDFRGKRVPKILLSGHHEKIKKWRREKSLEVTRAVRPDLLQKEAEKPAGTAAINFSIALVHDPVVEKSGKQIVSSITTLDIHDMARIGRTYGAKAVYIVTPVEEQKLMVDRITGHWLDNDSMPKSGANRVEALSLIKVVPSVELAVADAKKRAGAKVKLLATSAALGADGDEISPAVFLKTAGEAAEWLILFGTAYGMAESLLKKADCRLAPVTGGSEFNHLPVRAASAIILDRLFGS